MNASRKLLIPLKPLTPLNPSISLISEGTQIDAARRVLERLTAAGLEFHSEGEALRWRGPAGIVTDADVALMKAHKADFLAALAGLSEDTHQAEAGKPATLPPLEALESDPYFLRARDRIHPTVRRGMSPEELTQLAYDLARADMGLSARPYAVSGHIEGEVVHLDGRRTFDAGQAYRDAHNHRDSCTSTVVNEHQDYRAPKDATGGTA